MQEVWKEITGTDSKYSVSNLGRIRNNGFYTCIGNKQERFVKPKIRKLLKHNQGYSAVLIPCLQKFNALVHRLVAIEFLPNPNNLEFVNHKNGIKTDNRVENLEWVTRQENETHAFKTGLKNSTGSNNTMSKLNESDVKIIKDSKGIKTNIELSQIYNVHVCTIQRIWKGKIWTHVK